MIHLDVLAGKMTFDGKKVSPDSRKGILRVVIDPENDHVKVQWLDRSHEPAVVDGEWNSPVAIEPVPNVKTGKVFVLKPEVGEKQFIWIQQQQAGSAAGDAAGFAVGTVDNIEALINQIQLFAQMRSGKDAAEIYSQEFTEEEEQVGEDQMLVDLGHHHHHDGSDDEDDEELDYEGLMQQLIPQGNGDQLPEQLLALMLMDPEIQTELIANFVAMAAAYISGGQQAGVQMETPSATITPVPISAVVQSEEAIRTLTSDEEMRKRLLDLCPPGEPELEAVLRCPQFGEALRSLTEGVYSDQISLLFTSLGLDMKDVLSSKDPFEALCKALESKFRR
jgi:hypothetical protein